MSSIFISGSNVGYEFTDGAPLFKNFHFSFGQRIYGLVGPNGVGKTTFLKLLTQEVRPTHGHISLGGTMGVLPQIGIEIDEGQTVSDLLGVRDKLNALQSIQLGNYDRKNIDIVGQDWDLSDRIHETFNSLGIAYLDLNSLVSQLSGGERVKVYLAQLLILSPLIILLDEPTNNLDQEGRRALIDFIKEWKKCMIVVSHDRNLLFHVQQIIEISNQGLRVYGGNYEFYLEQRQIESDALEQRIGTAKQNYKKQKIDLQQSLERQQRRMGQGEKRAREGGIPKIVAGGLKRKAQGSLARIKDVQEGRLFQAQAELNHYRNQVREKNIIQIDVPETTVHSSKAILEMKEFNYKFSGSNSFLFLNPLSFSLVGPQRVEIEGKNGAGKSTLVKLIMQSVDGSGPLAGEFSGSLQLKTSRVAYLDQKTTLLKREDCSLLEEFSAWTPHLSESERRIRLGRFLFRQADALKKISFLSGGERMRAALVCILFSKIPPELLILDEPTNNLDIDITEQIESALSHFQGAMLVISHDHKFLENVGVSSKIQVENMNLDRNNS